jgi:hypothetical protein
MLDSLGYRVILLVDLNVLGFDWNFVLPFLNSHYYSELKGDVIHFATCFLGLNQHNNLGSAETCLTLFSQDC